MKYVAKLYIHTTIAVVVDARELHPHLSSFLLEAIFDFEQ